MDKLLICLIMLLLCIWMLLDTNRDSKLFKKYDRTFPDSDFRTEFVQRDFSETTKSGALDMENRSYSAHGAHACSFIWIESDRGGLGRTTRETRKTRCAAIKILQGESTVIPFRGFRWRMCAEGDVIPRVRETISIIVWVRARTNEELS